MLSHSTMPCTIHSFSSCCIVFRSNHSVCVDSTHMTSFSTMYMIGLITLLRSLICFRDRDRGAPSVESVRTCSVSYVLLQTPLDLSHFGCDPLSWCSFGGIGAYLHCFMSYSCLTANTPSPYVCFTLVCVPLSCAL